MCEVAPGPTGAITLGATLWYWAIQAMQFRRALGVSWGRAVAGAVWVYIQAIFSLLAIGFLLIHGFG